MEKVINEKCANIIIKLSCKAKARDCVPVGAIIVKNDKIISKAFNKKEKTHNPMDHAEIIAIKKACKKLKSWNLSGCVLYVTMYPCEMCRTVISEARIKKVFYLITNEKEKYKNSVALFKMNFEKMNITKIENEYLSLLRNFFVQKRKKSRKNNR